MVSAKGRLLSMQQGEPLLHHHFQPSVARRVEWGQGSIDMSFLAEPGDQFLGLCLAGLPPNAFCLFQSSPTTFHLCYGKLYCQPGITEKLSLHH